MTGRPLAVAVAWRDHEPIQVRRCPKAESTTDASRRPSLACRPLKLLVPRTRLPFMKNQNFRSSKLAFALLAVAASAVGAQVTKLGPLNGRELPPLDTGRVAIGTVAPDFTLESKDGGTVTLSQFRSMKNVVLVFYRGHW